MASFLNQNVQSQGSCNVLPKGNRQHSEFILPTAKQNETTKNETKQKEKKRKEKNKGLT